MNRSTPTSRRRALALSGAALTVGIAGCSVPDGDDETSPGEYELRREDWEDVDEIALNGFTNGWIGVEPDVIEGVKNPTLLLFEGTEYEIRWENRDGIRHNLALRDDDGDLVHNYETEYVRNRGDTASLTFDATPELHSYICDPHPRSMIGYIETVED